MAGDLDAAPASVANLVDLLAEETKPPADQNTLKAIDDLQAELAQVQAQLSRHKGQLRWTEWWLKTALRHIEHCADHSDKRHGEGPACRWVEGFTYTPSVSEE